MKIRNQYNLLMAILCIIFLLIGASAYYTNQQILSNEEKRTLAKNIVYDAYRINFITTDILLHPEEERQYLQWESVYQSLENNIDLLDVDDPSQQFLVDNVDASLEHMNDIYGQSVSTIEEYKKNHPGEPLDTEYIDITWSRFIVHDQALVFDASQLSQMLREESESLRRTNIIINLLLVGVFFVIILINFTFINRRIFDSVAVLREGSSILGSGNLDYAITKKYDDEIGDLVDDFNDMAKKLKTVKASKVDLEAEIAKRKKIQHDLEESEAILKRTGELARVGGWEVDADTLEVTWTDETYQIHEVPVGEMPPLEEAINFFHPDDREKLSSAIQRALETGEGYDIELRLITAKGKELWTRSLCKTEIADGKIVRLIGTFQDITDRKLGEQEIINLNSLLKSISGVNELIIKETDLKLLMQGACEILEQTRDYRNVEIALPGDETGIIMPFASSGAYRSREWSLSLNGEGNAPRCIKECLNTGKSLKITDPDSYCRGCDYFDEHSMHETLIIPILRNERIFGIISVALIPKHRISQEEIDLLEEVAADLGFAIEKYYIGVSLQESEEKLLASHNRLNNIINFLPDATFVLDRDEKVIAWNNAMEKLTGIPKEDMLGYGDRKYSYAVYKEKSPVLIDYILNPDQECSERYKNIKTSENFISAEIDFAGAYGGKGAYLLGIASILYDNDGNVDGAIESIRDISDLKKKEKDLIQTINEKNVAITEIHHRVKNNLQIISALLQMQQYAIDNPEYSQLFGNMNNRVLSIANVYENLIEKEEFLKIYMPKLINDLISNSMLSHPHKNVITIDKDVVDESMDLNVAVSLSMIISELLVNTVKHAFLGREKGHVRVYLRRDGEKGYLLEISDDGVGYKGEMDLSKAKTLGMRLVGILVEKDLHGTVDIEVDGGTKFIIRFVP